MISVSIRRTLCSPESEIQRVGGLSIPNWDELNSVQLLRAVDYYEDAAFNHHQIGPLLQEIATWMDYETTRNDPEQRLGKLDEVRRAVEAALDRRCYVLFLSL